ncbi:UNVERIFIED_CONTAM: Serine hydroxymethyltransferase 2, mitochondrial [Sesamum calycinum]|uniref:Serine hydroxymethyltransferase 2, mitochondrial n=1 Tax=Sesamum calycinum TaxID=2727403 RepID=A0AAW2QLS5_9LAMI
MAAMALRRLSSLRPVSNSYSLRYMSSFANQAVSQDSSRITWTKQLNAPLEEVDPEIADIIELEKARQWKGLELIPSENFTSLSVMQAVGSVMTNKYSEGYPGARYYGGNEYIDMAESLCQKRALETFKLDPAWRVVICVIAAGKELAVLFRPKLIVAGASAYARLYDYARIRKVMYDYEDKINQAVFPGLQGGPHNHTITALAVALKQAMTPEYKAYQDQVLSNCSKFAETLVEKGYDLVSGGTENHLVLVNLRDKGIDGSRVEKVLEAVHIAANKNTVPGDVSAMVPGGIRMGTPALTSRGFVEEDFAKVAEFFDAAVKLALKIKADTNGTKLKDFVTAMKSDAHQTALSKLRFEVEEYAKQFPTIGFEKKTMKYKD